MSTDEVTGPVQPVSKSEIYGGVVRYGKEGTSRMEACREKSEVMKEFFHWIKREPGNRK